MSERLQVLFDEQELDAIRETAAREGMTVSEWVRQVLRGARRERPLRDQARKLAAVRVAARHHLPAGEIDEMLREIEQGYVR